MPSWGELLNELQPHKNENGEDVQGLTVDELREKYLKLLSQQTGRNVIAYYSGWLKPGKTQNIDINDSDMFADETNGAEKRKKVSKIVNKLNANNKSHSRHFTVNFCKELGLNVTALEDDQSLQEAVLSVHHAFIITIDQNSQKNRNKQYLSKIR